MLDFLCVTGQMEEFANFDFNIWRKRYIQWISHLKSRILDVFRSIDRDQDGRISHKEFIDYVLASSKIPKHLKSRFILPAILMDEYLPLKVCHAISLSLSWPTFKLPTLSAISCRISHKCSGDECSGKHL